MTVWKYVMKGRELVVSMPIRSQVLSCQAQNGLVCIWAMGDENAPLQEKRHFVSIGTGEKVRQPAEKLRFVGTFLLGATVGHVFELL